MKTTYRTDAQRALGFSKEEGIKIQTEHLEQWKSVLAEEPWKMLKELVTKGNDEAVDGFDITRGMDIDNIIHNEVIHKFLPKTGELGRLHEVEDENDLIQPIQ
jgi:hypothetical protein